MIDTDLSSIYQAILKKKKLMDINQDNIDYLIDDVFSTKIQIGKNNTASKNSFLKSRVKIYTAKIKKLKKVMRTNIKAIKIYDDEYKKKLKNPSYIIDFSKLN